MLVIFAPAQYFITLKESNIDDEPMDTDWNQDEGHKEISNWQNL